MDRPRLLAISGRGEPSPPFRAFSLGVRSSSIPICLRLSAPRIPLSLAVVIVAVAAEEVDDEGEGGAGNDGRADLPRRKKQDPSEGQRGSCHGRGKREGNVQLLWRKNVSLCKPAQTESRQGWGNISLIVRTAFFPSPAECPSPPSLARPFPFLFLWQGRTEEGGRLHRGDLGIGRRIPPPSYICGREGARLEGDRRKEPRGIRKCGHGS